MSALRLTALQTQRQGVSACDDRLSASSEEPAQRVSQETIAVVMSKLQDINADGLAYTCIYSRDEYHVGYLKSMDATLHGTLKQGLLGRIRYDLSPQSVQIDDYDPSMGVFEDSRYGKLRFELPVPEANRLRVDRCKDLLFKEWNETVWVQQMRQHEKPIVNFNINGRSSMADGDGSGPLSLIEDSCYVARGDNKLIILFRLDRFKELPIPRKRDLLYLNGGKIDGGLMRYRGYQVNCEGTISEWRRKFGDLESGDPLTLEHLAFKPAFQWYECYCVNKDGKITANSEYGFILSPRVPARDFQGIVIKGKIDYREIVATTLNTSKDKPERLLPIYSTKGDLLWPIEMPYEQVKKWVGLQ